MLLEAWRDFEREDGDEKSQAEVQLFIDIGLFLIETLIESLSD